MSLRSSHFGRYILAERIASGGMGEVFVALRKPLKEEGPLFALKRILPGLGEDSDFLMRFKEEARLVIPMNHPNVVHVYEVGRYRDQYFIAMEFVEGLNLGHFLSAYWKLRHSQKISIITALYIVRELLKGLEYVHQFTDASGDLLGVVHRDVSPSNVLISFEGEIKLIDFGLALSTLKDTRTEPNFLLGHMGYIDPQRLDGLPVDHRADIFCAGVLLFELLTGKRFAPGNDPGLIRGLIKVRSNMKPSLFREDLPEDIDQLVLRAVAQDPNRRFSTALEFQNAILRIMNRINALYGPRQFMDEVLEPLFHATAKKKQLRDNIHQLVHEEISRNLAAEGFDAVRAMGPQERNANPTMQQKRGNPDEYHPFPQNEWRNTVSSDKSDKESNSLLTALGGDPFEEEVTQPIENKPLEEREPAEDSPNELSLITPISGLFTL